MSALASLRARLRRLEQVVAAGPDEVDCLIKRQPIGVLLELANAAGNPSPRVQALLEDLLPQCATGGEVMVRLIERLGPSDSRVDRR